jgi:RNA 2',3'-cyclic 3'-phosphodiesterase
MARTTRTFIAVEIPGKLGHKLARLQSLLAPEVPGARWVEPTQFHVTLAFLGNVDDTDLNPVCKAVAEAASGFGPMTLRLEGLGAFPDPKRPRNLWVGMTGPGVETLVAFQKKVASAARQAGYPPDDQHFHPHVTLGRLKPGKGPSPDLTPQINHYRTWAAGSFDATEAVTFASTLTSESPVYAPLGRAPFWCGKPVSDA